MNQLDKMLESTEVLMKAAAKDCALELENNKELTHTKMSAANILLEGDEEVQIQITVTRVKDEFLEDFQMETMKTY